MILEFGVEVRLEFIGCELEVASVEMRHEAMELNKILQAVSVATEEKRTEGWAPGMPIFRKWEDGKDLADETGKDQPGS